MTAVADADAGAGRDAGAECDAVADADAGTECDAVADDAVAGRRGAGYRVMVGRVPGGWSAVSETVSRNRPSGV